MQLTHEGPDEAWLDLAEECELLIWSSVSFSFGNCKKNPKTKSNHNRLKRATLKLKETAQGSAEQYYFSWHLELVCSTPEQLSDLQ